MDSEKLVLPRPDMIDTPFPEADLTLFIDCSSSETPEGKTISGYAVVTQTTVLEGLPLPHNYSAKAAELVALTGACTLAKGKAVTIYTDSQYFNESWINTFQQGCVHSYRNILSPMGSQATLKKFVAIVCML